MFLVISAYVMSHQFISQALNARENSDTDKSYLKMLQCLVKKNYSKSNFLKKLHCS